MVTYLSKVFENDDLIKLKLKSEIDFWTLEWQKKFQLNENVPDSALETYKKCNAEIYPTLKIILQILCTLPVTVASAKRSFSALKRLKGWLRSNMTQERLTGLALLIIAYS